MVGFDLAADASERMYGASRANGPDEVAPPNRRRALPARSLDLLSSDRVCDGPDRPSAESQRAIGGLWRQRMSAPRCWHYFHARSAQ